MKIIVKMAVIERPIGVLDLGIGGLSILDYIIELMPNEKYVFIGDNKRTAYSRLEKEQLVAYAAQVGQYLVSCNNIKALVIACNTISTFRAEIQEQIPHIPVIGVIQSTTNWLLNGEVRRGEQIGLLATRRTVLSGVYSSKLYEEGIETIAVDCTGIAKSIDNYLDDEEQTYPLIKKYVKDLFNAPKFDANKMKQVLLGCTHYSLVKELFHRAIEEEGYHFPLFDPSESVASELKKKLETVCTCPAQYHVKMIFTSDSCSNSVEKLIDCLFILKGRERPEISYEDPFVLD